MAENYEKWVKRSTLYIWREYIGWRRFFMADWWRLKLNIKVSEE